MRLVFRVLVVAAIFATALYWVMPYIDYMWYSNDQLVLLGQAGLGASIVHSDLFYGIQILTPVEMLLSNIIALADGAIIANM